MILWLLNNTFCILHLQWQQEKKSNFSLSIILEQLLGLIEVDPKKIAIFFKIINQIYGILTLLINQNRVWILLNFTSSPNSI